ncbi:MAG: pyridoxine 5'-phosphate synthase [Brevinema sp.]
MKKQLGVNIDHIAALRQIHSTSYPEPLQAAYLVQNAGAHKIIVHLLEDHLQKRDIYLIREACSLPLNMQMSLSDDMTHIALDLCPEEVCIVNNERKENGVTGGLDLSLSSEKLEAFILKAQNRHIKIGLSINHDEESIKSASELGADIVELYTGIYADTLHEQKQIIEELKHASQYAHSLGLQVNAGHKLHYNNVQALISIPEIHTLNIGHAIISRAVFVGLDRAIRDMLILFSS